MRKNLGLVLTAATLLVTARFSAGPSVPSPSQTPVTTPNPVPSDSVSKANHTKDEHRIKCTAYDKPSASRTVPSDDAESAAFKVVTKFVDGTKYADSSQFDHIRFVIATVPDPKHTNLSLFFDRQMDAIQSAAQDEGYSYDSSWMPWTIDHRAYPLMADDQLRSEFDEHRETCPGIVTFWKDPIDSQKQLPGESLYKNGLMVLVVGEQPTGGINEDQWTNAINWISSHTSADHEDSFLRVLGPTFSGSLISLQRAIQKVSDPPEKLRKFTQIRAMSGTVSSCRLLTWFENKSSDNVLSSSFQENDALQIHRFLNFIHEGGWQTSDVAIISEDETSYARSVADSESLGACNSSFFGTDKQPVSLPYPRDISALRIEYQKQAVGINGAQRSSHFVLDDNAEVPERNSDTTDTITSYAGRTAPLAQEAVLYGIVGYLRTHHTRYLILRCTNPLDFLFLARFFHRAYPIGRIVTVGSDMLFVRELESTDFRGLIALSNYPLRPSGEWLPKNPKGPHVHRVFEAHTMEGEYLAGRYSFGPYSFGPYPFGPYPFGPYPFGPYPFGPYPFGPYPFGPYPFGPYPIGPYLFGPYWIKGAHGSNVILDVDKPLPDVEIPNWVGLTQSATIWQTPTLVTVLAREGYWPISVLPAVSPPPTETPRSTSVSYQRRTANPQGNKSPWFPISWQICQDFALALFAYEAFGLFAGHKFASIGLLSPFRKSSSSSHVFLLGENAGLASGLLLLFVLLDFGSQATELSSGMLLYLNWWFWFWVFLFGVIVGLSRSLKDHWSFTFICGFICTLAATTGASLAALQVGRFKNTGSVRESDHYALYYRIFHLTSGISPMLPILFLILGLYLWNWLALAGNGLLLAGLPILPSSDSDKTVPNYLVKLDLDPDRKAEVKLSKARFRISAAIEWRIISVANPLSFKWQVSVMPVLLGLGMIFYFWENLPMLGLETISYSVVIDAGLLVTLLLTVAECARLCLTWSELRQLLAALQRLRLRRTFSRLRAIDTTTLWSVSGDVSRIQYRFFKSQIDAARRLLLLSRKELPIVTKAVACADQFVLANAAEVDRGPSWNEELTVGKENLLIRNVVADAVAEVLNHLEDYWRLECDSLDLEREEPQSKTEEPIVSSLPLSESPKVRAAEEFVCFHYIAFVQNILGRMRTMTLSMMAVFITSCFSISFYPFIPRTQVSIWMIANLTLIGVGVIYVYAKMERDEILSYITNTSPGHLTLEFWLKTAAFLIGPVIGILTTQFPEIADAFLGSLQPSLEQIRSATGG